MKILLIVLVAAEVTSQFGTSAYPLNVGDIGVPPYSGGGIVGPCGGDIGVPYSGGLYGGGIGVPYSGSLYGGGIGVPYSGSLYGGVIGVPYSGGLYGGGIGVPYTGGYGSSYGDGYGSSYGGGYGGSYVDSVGVPYDFSTVGSYGKGYTPTSVASLGGLYGGSQGYDFGHGGFGPSSPQGPAQSCGGQNVKIVEKEVPVPVYNLEPKLVAMNLPAAPLKPSLQLFPTHFPLPSFPVNVPCFNPPIKSCN
ncbi:keratin, type I cytoskeletal 9-like [Bacillus rossius redtenbacheri]|uniref:keratin, type I cytoskeletal 9-like n=1 Tax=Bacillus rossius redtenbacheri TaxID=93214 RepID=UPI002FDE309F